MRPLEIVLLAANLLALTALVAVWPATLRWMGHLAVLPLPVLIAQLLAEGVRWQMVPAYALAVLFFLLWLVKRVKPIADRLGEGGPGGLPPARPSDSASSLWWSLPCCRCCSRCSASRNRPGRTRSAHRPSTGWTRPVRRRTPPTQTTAVT